MMNQKIIKKYLFESGQSENLQLRKNADEVKNHPSTQSLELWRYLHYSRTYSKEYLYRMTYCLSRFSRSRIYVFFECSDR
jgi:hypothetical protein